LIDRNTTLTLYVSGDKGSDELRNLCAQKGVRVDARDIRIDRPALGHLIRWGLDTVPQVFDPDGSHLGDFAAVAAELRKLPSTPRPKFYA
jgi:hypothetical protein